MLADWLFAASAENNQSWGICGLVNRLYLGFYIPRVDGQVHLNMNLSIHTTKKYVSHLTGRTAGSVC